MSTLKEKVMEALETADEQLLQMIADIVQHYDSQKQSAVPDWVYQELEEERLFYLKNPQKAENWNALRQRLKETHGL